MSAGPSHASSSGLAGAEADLARLIAAELGTAIPKRPWQSRTIVFIAVSMAAKAVVLIPGLAGLQIDVGAVSEMLLLGLSFVADLGAIWGRNRASRPVQWRKGAAAAPEQAATEQAAPAPPPNNAANGWLEGPTIDDD